MPNLPLAAFLASLGDSLSDYADKQAAKRERANTFAERLAMLTEQLKVRQQLEEQARPGEERAKKRATLIANGIDPDTMQPFEGYAAARRNQKLLGEGIDPGTGQPYPEIINKADVLAGIRAKHRKKDNEDDDLESLLD